MDDIFIRANSGTSAVRDVQLLLLGPALSFDSHFRGRGGGISCQVKVAVVIFAAGNIAEAPGFYVVKLADIPRNGVACRALQARGSLATGATRGGPWILCGKFRGQFETRNFPHEAEPPPPPPPAVLRCGAVEGTDRKVRAWCS